MNYSLNISYIKFLSCDICCYYYVIISRFEFIYCLVECIKFFISNGKVVKILDE